VVTGDRDMLALATDRVTVLYTGKGIAKMEAMGPVEVQAKYGVPAAHYADFAVLRGDPSDGLPGVAGFGEKTAAALVSRFGPVEAIAAAAERGDDGFPAGAANKVRAAKEYLLAAPAAVRGRTDVPLAEIDDRLPATPRDPQRLAELAEALGVQNSVARLQKAISAALG
jgi:5'-3' exonuclease